MGGKTFRNGGNQERAIRPIRFCFCSGEGQNKIRAIQTKLQRLLDGYLEQDIEREIYREQKAILLSEKKSLDEKMARIEQKQNDWLEPMKEWIKVASTLVKIARDFEPAFGEPRRARRASVSIPFRASRGQTRGANSRKSNSGGRIWIRTRDPCDVNAVL